MNGPRLCSGPVASFVLTGFSLRLLLGDAVADELELPKGMARFAVRGLVPFVSLVESLRRATPFGDELAYRVGAHWIKAAMSRFDGART